MKLFSILLFCLSSFFAHSTVLQERFERIENNIQLRHQVRGISTTNQSIEQRMAQLNVPGLSIAVAKDGKIIWAKGYGLADVEQQIPVATDTLFQAASVSKPVAAFRAMQLADQGKLNLDIDVNEYLNDWKIQYGPYSNDQKVTTRRLLNHTAGMTIWGFSGYQRNEPVLNTLDVLMGKGKDPAITLFGEPGKNWLYSGGGYTVLEQVLSEMDGLPFAQLMHRHVLVPMGMTSSTFEVPLPEAFHSRAASAYYEDGTPLPDKWLNHPQGAAAGLWSTPTDLVQFAMQIQRIRKAKQHPHESLLSRKMVETMLTPGKNQQGLGPVVDDHTFWHNGSNRGFKAELVGWLEQDFAIAVLTNSDNRSITREIVMSIAMEFGLPGREPEIIDAIELSKEDREKFVGTYSIPELGKLELTLSEQGLTGTPDYYHRQYSLIPDSESTFVNIETGTNYTFEFEGGKVTGFSTVFGKTTKI